MPTAVVGMRWRGILPFISIILFSILLPDLQSTAQSDPASIGESAAGTYYVIAFPDTLGNSINTRWPNNSVAPEASLWIYSAVPNKVKIGPAGGAANQILVDGGRFTFYKVPWSFLVRPYNTPVPAVFTVESEHPVIIYCFLASNQSVEAWTALPVAQWGTEYYAAATPGESVYDVQTYFGEVYQLPFTQKVAPAKILVIAAYDNTNVTFVPPPGAYFEGTAQYSVKLNAGEAYQVASHVELSMELIDQQDIAATLIRSDKPIGVLSGNTRAQVIYEDLTLTGNVFRNMLMEWLSPADQHGTEFVYMPTMDKYRPGMTNVNNIERKREFVRVYSTQRKQAKGFYIPPGPSVKPFNFTMPADTMREFSLGMPSAVYFKTESPTQALMHSSTSVAHNPDTANDDFWLRFRGIAPYMVSLTPREQWSSFAPFCTPSSFGGQMSHYINVVTDTASARNIFLKTGSRFPFTRPIPGTDLIWGTMPLSSGEESWLEGRNGARFAGFVYGTLEGIESFTPGKVRKKEDVPTIASGGRKGPKPLHESVYQEQNALAYGYPLASLHVPLRPGDSILIDTVMDCTTLRIRITNLTPSPVGLRSISLDPATAINARLVAVDPQRLSDIIGSRNAEVRVEPIDPLRDAYAVVIIKDRTGKIWRVSYRYQAERLEIDPWPLLDFGEVTVGSEIERLVTITNPLARSIKVPEIRLAMGNRGFTIVKTEPEGPAMRPPQEVTLGPGEKLIVTVRVKPEPDRSDYSDTLRMTLGCAKVALPMKAVTSTPLIRVEDLSFGTFILGADGPKTLKLRICNVGDGNLRFDNPSSTIARDLLEWLDVNNFTVEDVAAIEKLKTMVLRKGECYEEIPVTFTPTQTGVYRTVARVWATTRDIRDTSVWTAIVIKPGVILTGYDWGKQWVTAAATANCTKNQQPHYEAIIEATNNGSAPARVKELVMPDQDAIDGYFRFETSDRRTTIMVGDQIDPGATVRQKVLFIPKEEREYSTRVLLITETNDTIPALLTGTGIESHGMISGLIYQPAFFRGVYPQTPGQVLTSVLRAQPTRALTITDVVIEGTNANDFSILNRGMFQGRVLQPGDTAHVAVEFRAQASGDREAMIKFIGDHSICDDSTNILTATTFVDAPKMAATGHAFGPGCGDADGEVTITNQGTEPVEVRGATLNDATGLFSLPQGSTPVLGILQPNETRRLPVHFRRSGGGSGAYAATVSFEVVDRNGASIQSPVVEVNGSIYELTVTAHINRGYRGMPGAVIDVPVLLDGDASSGVPAEERVTSFRLKLSYDGRMVRAAGTTPDDLTAMTKGTLVEGWGITLLRHDPRNGELELELTSPNDSTYLMGPGRLLNLKMQTFLSTVDHSSLSFDVRVPGMSCLKVVMQPGDIRLDSICGLRLRLIELITSSDYTLDQNKPNPFNPATTITFSLGLDGPTRMTIYDANGRKVATLIDGYMTPGKYQIEWDASGYASGLYYYRLESGHWRKTNTMILRK